MKCNRREIKVSDYDKLYYYTSTERVPDSVMCVCIHYIYISYHAKFKKLKLYILFIDYRKAYDKVPRLKLMECLKTLGCGTVGQPRSEPDVTRAPAGPRMGQVTELKWAGPMVIRGGAYPAC